MSSDPHLAAWVRLSLVPGVGPRKFRELLSRFGLPERILEANSSQLSSVVPRDIADRIVAHAAEDEVSRALDWASQPGQAIITLADASYPSQLFEISDPPPVLYVRGKVELLSRRSLAVVGSRSATPQGKVNAEAFARALSDAGLTIVSGLALGIDSAAHRGALRERGSTIAVVGTGADSIYPAANRELGEAIAAQGALISEFPLGTEPLAGNFPRRNRLISGLSRGCLVVEAALASGSLITARLAAEAGREVFAIPGSIHSPVAKGCHALIKQGAKLAESAEDILEELRGQIAQATPASPVEVEHVLLQHMGFDACAIDTLTARTGLTVETVSAMLLQLELEGKVGCLPGGLYQRID
jgi:DNA processing protein